MSRHQIPVSAFCKTCGAVVTSENIARHEHLKFPMTNNSDKIKLSFANRLAKDHGAWIWDGLLYERDGVVDPSLQILPNSSGAKLRRILRECYNERNY